MTINKTLAVCMAAAALCAAPASAQFDLASQRKEVQDYRAVPGSKLDHGGIIVNPTPHQLTLTPGAAPLNTAEGFKIDKKTAAAYSADFTTLGIPVSQSGAKLTVKAGAKEAAKAGVKSARGSYSLNIDPKAGVSITAADATGVFYALQTLRQLLDSPASAGGAIPALTVNDWPDLPYRGVVEGFYGNPWSHEVRLSLIDFYGHNKMTDYIYGPKDDPYHSSPYWRLPYPEQEAKNIRELVEACNRNHVNFIWAIHPGKDIRWDEADYDSLVSKLDMMYDLGVRSFALFFDDISGKGTDSNEQTKLVNDLTRDFVKAKGDVSNLMICPTDYSQLWANPKPTGQLAVYGNTLNPDVEVFWTGAVVCSDLTPETMDFVNTRIKRPALFWWNYPVTDYARNFLLQGPVYGLDTTLTAAQVAGIESNPMEHGEASKLALYGVADYAWNVGAYNPIDNWERGLAAIAPDAVDAYRTFAIHNGDTQTGYRRDESWETTTFPYNDYTPAQFDALAEEFAKIEAVPAKMRQIENKGLIAEIDPWLTQFGKLGQRGTKTLALIKTFENGNAADFWKAYTENLMSPQDLADYNAHKTGTLKLQPFYEKAMDGMLYDFYTTQAGRQPSIYKPVGTYRNLAESPAKLMLDNDTATFYTSGRAQATGHWIGLDLGMPTTLKEVEIIQGRNSIDDVDYFDNAILEYSLDGEKWLPLTGELAQQYEIAWHGEPVEARYVRLRKLESKKTNWAAVRSFKVNPVTTENVGITIESSNPAAALLAFDNNPATVFDTTGRLAFGRKSGANSAIILLDTPAEGSTLTVSQLDAKGNTLESRKIDTPYSVVSFNPETATIALEGHARIFEIIQK